MSDNISILVKLFETLKESSDRNEEATQKLIVQQLEMVNHIKHLPVEDLKEALKEHAKESSKEIDECAGTVELKTGDIMEMLRTILNKINKMVLVVVVAFTILMGSYVIIRTVAEKSKLSEHETLKVEQEESFNKKMEDVMEEIRKEMKALHDNKDG